MSPPPTPAAAGPARALALALRDIKLAHSVFALPFAVLGAFLARGPGAPWPLTRATAASHKSAVPATPQMIRFDRFMSTSDPPPMATAYDAQTGSPNLLTACLHRRPYRSERYWRYVVSGFGWTSLQ